MRRIEPATFVRQKLGMTQDAARHEAEPSHAEEAYLRAIERKPEQITKVLVG